MDMKLLGIEIVIHPKDKRPKYKPINHFRDVRDERWDEIKKAHGVTNLK